MNAVVVLAPIELQIAAGQMGGAQPSLPSGEDCRYAAGTSAAAARHCNSLFDCEFLLSRVHLGLQPVYDG